MKTNQEAHGLKVPLIADSVESPVVKYGGGTANIQFLTDDGRWGRVTFEKLDSIKVSRGEYEPFPPARGEENKFHWVSSISNSAWLQERYEYEKLHYASAYGFGGNVDEMLTDYSHYIFSFHDQFVEVLASGIWFESAEEMFGDNSPGPDHPLNGLGNALEAERFEAHGITCLVRRNPLAVDELELCANLCSQTILEVVPELDGRASTCWTLTRRVRQGSGKTYLRDYFGNKVLTFDTTPSLDSIRIVIDKWLAEVRQRRKEMGKA